VIEYSLQTILKTYAKRLTNLSSKNKSLLLLNLPNEQFIDVHELDFLQNQPSFSIIEQLIAQKNAISLCDTLDPRNERVNEVSKRLKKIARTEKFIEDERGAKDLYVGYPMVKGKLMDGTPVRCPLLFFPVTLIQKVQKLSLNAGLDSGSGIKWHLQRREEPVTFNRSFLLAYSHFNEIKIFDNFIEYSFEDFSKTSLEFRTQLYELLKVSPLNVNFNHELFTNQLHFFEKMLKADLETTERNGELKLYPQAVLGIFPQAGSFLVPDYEYLLAESEQNTTGLFREGEMQWLIPSILQPPHFKIREEKLITPLHMDASQEQVLRDIKYGKSLVVQGPPGTGKSQLICNLIADFTARGKTVLVVSQKRAALDVVYERLAKIGMQNFVGSIHDFKNDRKYLYDQVLHQIEQIEAYKSHNLSLDSIFLERTFDQESRKIDKIVEELQDFKDALFDTSVCGVSVKELYLTSSPQQPSVDLSTSYQYFKLDEIDDFVSRLKKYYQYQQNLTDTSIGKQFWDKRLRFNTWAFSEKKLIQQAFVDTLQNIQSTVQQLHLLLETPPQYEDLGLFEREKDAVVSLQKKLKNERDYQTFVYKRKQKITIRVHQLNQLFEQVKVWFGGQGIEVTLPSSQLLPFMGKLSDALDAKTHAFGGMMWTLFSKQKKEIQDVVLANGLSLSNEDLQKLQERLHNRIALEKWWQEWKYLFEKQTDNDTQPVWVGKGFRWFERHFEQLRHAIEADEIWQKLHLGLYLDVQVLSWKDFSQDLTNFLNIIQPYTEASKIAHKYLSVEQQKMLMSVKASQAVDITQYLDEHFDLLHEADQIHQSFTKPELELVDKLHAYQDTSVEKIKLLINSLKLAWIDAIEQKSPILRGVSSLKIAQLEEDLQAAIEKKQQLSKEILQMKLREQTYSCLEINRLKNVTTYRELKHQVSKKRKIWSIRKLMAELSDEVFNLIPCWLASPETVSAVFPLTTNNLAVSGKNDKDFHAVVFDLVIFDEASQCYAEQGVPSIFRGKQIVIAGDSKQLTPSDLYRVRFDENTDDIPALEVDSFLDLGCQYLPQLQLQGHYRSRSLDLIDFSNQHFYNNSLQLLPTFEDMNHKEPAIDFVKVDDGLWQNNANYAEAMQILTTVQALRDSHPQKSVGIVTFNFKQQSLIQDLLEQHINRQDKGPLEAHKEPIFVKNIENVQGDERDIILFSIGYAPDASGKFSMNFGTLNASGGENRLNVAITRAREKIIIVSSILPHQLNVENATHEGPKLLKKYLEYAKRVADGLYTPTVVPSKAYWANWLLKEQLSNSVVNYLQELPFADITVKRDQRYDSLILTDDDLFYEGLSAKQTFAYIPQSLRQKGWKFSRIFSREYWKNTKYPK
jgi:KaiC/GvpD/RAD55 family RecA-like ATPase